MLKMTSTGHYLEQYSKLTPFPHLRNIKICIWDNKYSLGCSQSKKMRMKLLAAQGPYTDNRPTKSTIKRGTQNCVTLFYQTSVFKRKAPGGNDVAKN